MDHINSDNKIIKKQIVFLILLRLLWFRKKKYDIGIHVDEVTLKVLIAYNLVRNQNNIHMV